MGLRGYETRASGVIDRLIIGIIHELPLYENEGAFLNR